MSNTEELISKGDKDERRQLWIPILIALVLFVAGFVFLLVWFQSATSQQASHINQLSRETKANSEQAQANASALNKANGKLRAKGVPTVAASSVPGSTGAQGIPGPPGPPGPPGENGKNGAAGASGPAGAPGSDGAKGDPGVAGITGSQGPSGVDGAAGENGIPGEDGEQGPKGDSGEQGPKGDTGPAGEKGDAGTDGAPGKDGTDGKNGRGIDSISCGDDDNWLITYSDDTSETVEGPCRVAASSPSGTESPPTASSSPEVVTTQEGKG